MRLLVDGNNVMGSRPDGWWRDRRDGMQRLVNDLDDLAERTGDEIAIVFDGRDQALQVIRATVSFAGHADDLIAAKAGPGQTVVTSDAELVRRVRAKGAAVLNSKALLDLLRP